MPKTIEEWQEHIGAWGKRKGWEFTEDAIPEKLMLTVSELSEALEEYRSGHAPTHVYFSAALDSENETASKPEGFGVELADAMIRLMHIAHAFNIPLGHLIELKMAYNEKRPFRHGKVC